MTDWNRKHASEIANAIHNWQTEIAKPANARDRLARIFVLARDTSRYVPATDPALDNVKQQLCEVCRREKLYVCDQKVGWSPNCAFLKANQP